MIKIVLDHTTHPGNIGSAARAMKTMGLSQMVLVEPKNFPCGEATALAAGADDLLANAIVVSSLEEAIADCALVIGTSHSRRSLPWPMLSPKEAALKLVAESQQHNVALVFGTERSGLCNEQLARCHFHVQIPSTPEFSSLNLAMAVQVLCYELRLATLGEQIQPSCLEELASDGEVEEFYRELESTLTQVNYLKAPRKAMVRIRRLFQRSRLEKMELGILWGIVASLKFMLKHSDVHDKVTAE